MNSKTLAQMVAKARTQARLRKLVTEETRSKKASREKEIRKKRENELERIVRFDLPAAINRLGRSEDITTSVFVLVKDVDYFSQPGNNPHLFMDVDRNRTWYVSGAIHRLIHLCQSIGLDVTIKERVHDAGPPCEDFMVRFRVISLKVIPAATIPNT